MLRDTKVSSFACLIFFSRFNLIWSFRAYLRITKNNNGNLRRNLMKLSMEFWTLHRNYTCKMLNEYLSLFATFSGFQATCLVLFDCCHLKITVRRSENLPIPFAFQPSPPDVRICIYKNYIGRHCCLITTTKKC